MSEKDKNEIARYDTTKAEGMFRGVPIKSLRRLSKGDVSGWSDYDVVWMFAVTKKPLFMVRPIFKCANGQDVETIDDPRAPYSTNEIRTKMRYIENYAIVDARAVIAGRIDRS